MEPTKRICTTRQFAELAKTEVSPLVNDDTRILCFIDPLLEESGANFEDLTPFKTRTKLLTQYRAKVDSIRSGGNPYPVALEVNLSNACSQKCSWCISGKINRRGIQGSDRDYLPLDDVGVQHFFQDFVNLGGKSIVWSGGGEPTNHPKIADAILQVNSMGASQGLITHGVFDSSLAEVIADHCNWVRISIDTHDPAAYAKNRGVSASDFDQLRANIKALVSRAGARIGLNMNVSEWNKNDISDLYNLSSELGVSYLQVRPTLAPPGMKMLRQNYLHSDSIPCILDELNELESSVADENTKLIVSRDKFQDGCKSSPSRGYKGCKSHQIFVVLHSTGELMVCMYHLGNSDFVLGNVKKSTLAEIWKSEKRSQTVGMCSQIKDHGATGCQECCKGHEINKVLLQANDLPLPIRRVDDSPFV